MTDAPKSPSALSGQRFIALFLVAFLVSGCVTNGYRGARKDTPASVPLGAEFDPGRLEASLVTLVTYNGPGSWKRDATWDEYVVTVRNLGATALTISGAALTDGHGAVRQAGTAPWALEKESRKLEKDYRKAGVAFVRHTAPGILIAGTGAAAVASAGVMSAAAGTAAAATLVLLPVYYASVLTINHRNKRSMERVFQERRLQTPLRLEPGESRSGSLFFPMVPSPGSLSLEWSDASSKGDATLGLGFLSDLHVKKADQSAARAKTN